MSHDEPRRADQNKSGTPTEAELRARLDRLGETLSQAKIGNGETAGRETSTNGSSADGVASDTASSLGKAFRLSSEFIAGIVAGAGLGWIIDRVAGSSPWGLIIFLMLGFCAGIYNVVRASGSTGGPSRPGGPSPD